MDSWLIPKVELAKVLGYYWQLPFPPSHKPPDPLTIVHFWQKLQARRWPRPGTWLSKPSTIDKPLNRRVGVRLEEKWLGSCQGNNCDTNPCLINHGTSICQIHRCICTTQWPGQQWQQIKDTRPYAKWQCGTPSNWLHCSAGNY